MVFGFLLLVGLCVCECRYFVCWYYVCVFR